MPVYIYHIMYAGVIIESTYSMNEASGMLTDLRAAGNSQIVYTIKQVKLHD